MSTPTQTHNVASEDPWLDPFTSLGKESPYFQDITAVAQEEGFGEPAPPSPDAPDGTPLPLAPVTPVEPVEPVADLDGTPKILPVDGGGTLTLEKGNKGWSGTLETGVPGAKPQVFYGKTKDELLINFAKAQLNATKKIHELNRKVKLGDLTPQVVQPQPKETLATLRPLTADEAFEYKTLLDSDPAAAQDYLIEKRYGLKPEQFAQRLNETVHIREQNRLADIDRISWDFVKTNTDYYRDPDSKNFFTMVKYLSREHLGRIPAFKDIDGTVKVLYDAGVWTIEHLEAAKEDLTESGLLLREPAAPARTETTPVAPVAVTPQEEPQPQAQPPVPAQSISVPVRQRAANLGIRVQPSATPVTTETALTAEDPSSMSDEALETFMHGLRQNRARMRN